MFSTERPRQTKELVCVLQFPEALGFNGSYVYTLLSSWITFFLLTTPHMSMQLQMHKQSSLWAQTHTQLGHYSLGNGCLAAETLRELVACLFPPLLCFHWNIMLLQGGEQEERKTRIFWLLTPPVFTPHLSNHPLPLLHPSCKAVETPTVHSWQFQATLKMCWSGFAFQHAPWTEGLCERIPVNVFTRTTTDSLMWHAGHGKRHRALNAVTQRAVTHINCAQSHWPKANMYTERGRAVLLLCIT